MKQVEVQGRYILFTRFMYIYSIIKNFFSALFLFSLSVYDFFCSYHAAPKDVWLKHDGTWRDHIIIIYGRDMTEQLELAESGILSVSKLSWICRDGFEASIFKGKSRATE